MPKNKLQKDIILEQLRAIEWFNAVDAVHINILRLSSVIYDLKADGYIIEKRIVAGKTYAEYKLLSELPMKRVAQSDIVDHINAMQPMKNPQPTNTLL